MTARLEFGRASLTSWEVAEKFAAFTFLTVDLGTGRTHQIRAHMASIGHPVAGDKMYGAEPSQWNRYFLHAHRLVFRSPAAGQAVTVESPLPAIWRRGRLRLFRKQCRRPGIDVMWWGRRHRLRGIFCSGGYTGLGGPCWYPLPATVLSGQIENLGFEVACPGGPPPSPAGIHRMRPEYCPAGAKARA